MRLYLHLNESATRARQALWHQRESTGAWRGELSSSALSTAVACLALAVVDRGVHGLCIERGWEWLLRHQNADGGYGDTPDSLSNISTSILVWAAAGRLGRDVSRLDSYIERVCGGLTPQKIATAVTARYGQDRTFSVPILMAAALGGRLGPKGWKWVWPLPFELAAFPRSWFAALRLPVVSYALPALISIGQARQRQQPVWWAFWRATTRKKTAALLSTLQPATGGFLEATPLTSFVTMAMVAADQPEHPVIGPGVGFLTRSQRADGSWPIDTDLSTWVTTRALEALHEGPSDEAYTVAKAQTLRWLYDQQYREIHPFTEAAPGGWAWTDLPGGVPDADDTSGALLALARFFIGDQAVLQQADLSCTELLQAAESGLTWLIKLQNNDGGVPTFCRGWGRLPFDRSSPDITAHALRAWQAWAPHVSVALRQRLHLASRAARAYLGTEQQHQGTWQPLWFGHQFHPDEANPLYGTTQVIQALDPQLGHVQRAYAAICRAQSPSGGWGSGSGSEGPGVPYLAGGTTIEETALCLTALAHHPQAHLRFRSALEKGIRWLIEQTDGGRHFPPAPIGFYFAKLWYAEKLYPLCWSVRAFHLMQKLFSERFF